LLARLAVQLFEKAYAPGEAVFSEGDPGKGLFVVLDGEIEVVRDTGQGPQRIVTFGPGTAFGELALIDDLPRSASAVATTPTRLLILYRSHFEDLVAGDRVIALVVAKNLLRLLAGYVRAANVTRVKAEAAVAPAPAGDARVPPAVR
jgi:CRP-like cAMP-binding protein